LAPPVFEKLYTSLIRNPALRSVSLPGEPSGMSAGGVLVIDGIDRRFPTYVAERLIDEHYFSTVGLPILAGRDFSAQDDARAPLAIIVSESFGRLIADGGNAVGHRVRAYHGKAGSDFPTMTVVGVVPDVITKVSDLQPLVMYLPVAQDFGAPIWRRQMMARPAGDLKWAEAEIAATVRQLDSAERLAPEVTVLTMDEQMSRQMGPQRLGATVLGALGGLALLLTLLGTYVLAESMAVVRRREMGIRAALGARGLNLGAIVLSETGRLVGLGLVVGLFIVWADATTIRAFLLKTEPLDIPSLAGTAGLILIVTAFVSLRPAIAASRIDIVRVLRDE
jgi:ABC-type antimicrobial peptide transport system permease subunit